MTNYNEYHQSSSAPMRRNTSPVFRELRVEGVDSQLSLISNHYYYNSIIPSSFIDLNRAGTGLMELVFELDLCNGLEASALVRELLLIFERIKTCSGRMEELR
eukprot:XP_016660927.1 PREDICTED: glutamyl-tRNA(Gln) amidotransferase subunit B, mitochondrial-like [Acyrthosiphon pisum]